MEQEISTYRTKSFLLSQEEKNQIKRFLPRGFHFVTREYVESQKNVRKGPLEIDVDFDPVEVSHEIDCNQVYRSFLLQNMEQGPKDRPEKRKSEKGIYLLEKIKSITQKLRKNPKFTLLAGFLNKTGLYNAFEEIEHENKKGLLTLEALQERLLLLLRTIRNSTCQEAIKDTTDGLIEDVLCYIEQFKTAQFQNNLQIIQKSIDRITRYRSQNICSLRKKRKPQKVEKNYSKREIMYIGSLLRQLPQAYMVGVQQIIGQSTMMPQTTFKLQKLTNGKLRDIQLYTKAKLNHVYQSRKNKREKIHKKLAQKCREEKNKKQSNLRNDSASNEQFLQKKESQVQGMQEDWGERNQNNERDSIYIIDEDDSSDEYLSSDSSLISDENDSDD